MCDEIAKDLVNDAVKGIDSDRKVFKAIKKRIEENEAFKLEVEAVLFVCKDLTKSVDSTAICVNAIQHLNDIIKKYNKPEKAES